MFFIPAYITSAFQQTGLPDITAEQTSEDITQNSSISSLQPNTDAATSAEIIFDSMNNPKQLGKKVTLLGPKGETCILELGMLEDEMLFEINKANIIIKRTDTEGKYRSYATDDYHFSVYISDDDKKQSSLQQILVHSAVISTERGLYVGDLEEKVEELYGVCELIVTNEEEEHRYYYYTYPEEGYKLVISAGDWRTDDQYVFEWMIETEK